MIFTRAKQRSAEVITTGVVRTAFPCTVGERKSDSVVGGEGGVVLLTSASLGESVGVEDVGREES